MRGHPVYFGTVGDAFDNALAETTIGLYKTEAVRPDSPFRRGPLDPLADVELLTADWVHWHNTGRLMHRLGRIPPIEYYAVYYATNTAPSGTAHS
jgi:putative transposase